MILFPDSLISLMITNKGFVPVNFNSKQLALTHTCVVMYINSKSLELVL